MRAMTAGMPFTHVTAEGYKDPVFSESYLYSIMCKEDARFILAVAEEYEELIRELGVDEVRRLLGR